MCHEVKHFILLGPEQQVEYLKSGEFATRQRCERIQFLKALLVPDLPSLTTACALRLLRELNYPDRYYFRKFLYHIDSNVSNAARTAINECCAAKEDHCFQIVKVLAAGTTDDRLVLVDFFLQDKGKLNGNVLIAFLNTDDPKVREKIVKKITNEYELDEALLSDTITKGLTWYVRAALVEILGKRKSHHLFDNIEFLIKDSNVEVKLKLIHALSNYETETRKKYLQKLSTDSLIWVRKEANRALQTC